MVYAYVHICSTNDKIPVESLRPAQMLYDYVSLIEARKAGFGQSDVAREFPSSLRNNSRLIHFSDALALALPHVSIRTGFTGAYE